MAYQEGIARELAILFPETIDDYIAEDNPVQFIVAFVDFGNTVNLGSRYGTSALSGIDVYSNTTDVVV